MRIAGRIAGVRSTEQSGIIDNNKIQGEEK